MMTTATSGVPASTPTQETYYTVEEVCSQLKVTGRSVHRWMSQGKLRYLKIGGAVRIPASAITEHLQGGKQ